MGCEDPFEIVGIIIFLLKQLLLWGPYAPKLTKFGSLLGPGEKVSISMFFCMHKKKATQASRQKNKKVFIFGDFCAFFR